MNKVIISTALALSAISTYAQAEILSGCSVYRNKVLVSTTDVLDFESNGGVATIDYIGTGIVDYWQYMGKGRSGDSRYRLMPPNRAASLLSVSKNKILFIIEEGGINLKIRCIR